MLRRAIVRPPSANFAEGLTTVDRGKPVYRCALDQHQAYCAALERCGLALTRLAPDPSYPDSTFIEDTAVLMKQCSGEKALSPKSESGVGTRRCAILTRPGAPSRLGEVANVTHALVQFYSSIESIREPGTLDGGDVCEAANHFFIGISERTNEIGAQQLAEFLAAFSYTASVIDIRGVKGILHLKSGLAYLGDNRLVVIEALRNREEFGGYDLVRVDAHEEYAANCVRVNDYLLMAAGYPIFERILRELAYQTIALEMSEFQKMDGGLSCLSLRF